MLYVKPCILKSCWSWQPWPALRGKRSSCCGSFSAREWTLAVIGGSQPWRGVVARKRGWEWVEAQTKSCRSIIRITLLLTCSGRWICKKQYLIIFASKALHTSSCNFQFAYIEMPNNKILSTPVNGSWVVNVDGWIFPGIHYKRDYCSSYEVTTNSPFVSYGTLASVPPFLPPLRKNLRRSLA